jgi:gamma-glutamyltranspeptidase/glutathione hydrolase
MNARRAAAASETYVAQAARDALTRGNAVDAVATALLIAAAEEPTVLLGPVQMLVGGAGAGLAAIDGRNRQPGLGAPRPRGVVPGEPVPPSARVGVPALPAAVATALASFGRVTLLRAAGPAIETARHRSPERRAVIESFARKGPAALLDEAIVEELVAVAGRAAGGSLTRDDLRSVRPSVVTCPERSLDAAGFLHVPWRVGALDGSSTQVVAAADGRGMLAIACYEAPPEGLALPSLGLSAPAAASPVLRGQPRVRPGEPRPSATPIALQARQGIVELAVGVAQAVDAEECLATALAKLTSAPTLAEALAGGAGRPVALVWTRESARVVSSA